jgi:hypothetical protein
VFPASLAGMPMVLRSFLSGTFFDRGRVHLLDHRRFCQSTSASRGCVRQPSI